jgi:hypothetical protein
LGNASGCARPRASGSDALPVSESVLELPTEVEADKGSWRWRVPSCACIHVSCDGRKGKGGRGGDACLRGAHWTWC